MREIFQIEQYVMGKESKLSRPVEGKVCTFNLVQEKGHSVGGNKGLYLFCVMFFLMLTAREAGESFDGRKRLAP